MNRFRHAFVVLTILCVPTWAADPYERQYFGPVFDVHLHAFSFELQGLGGVFPNPLTGRTYTGANSADEQMAQTYDRLEKYNVVKAIASGSMATAWFDADPERILVGGMVGMTPTSPEGFRAQFEAGKLHAIGEMGPYYQGLLADDPTVLPYFDLADELGLPVGYHILPGGGPGSLYQGGLMANIRAANAGPLQLEEVLAARPNLKLYMMHAGWPYLDDVKALMYAHPQLYVEVSAINWLLPREEFHTFLRGLTQAGFGKRVLYGSDQMGWAETIDDGFEAIDSAPFLSDEQKADIFYNNAVRLVGTD